MYQNLVVIVTKICLENAWNDAMEYRMYFDTTDLKYEETNPNHSSTYIIQSHIPNGRHNQSRYHKADRSLLLMHETTHQIN